MSIVSSFSDQCFKCEKQFEREKRNFKERSVFQTGIVISSTGLLEVSPQLFVIFVKRDRKGLLKRKTCYSRTFVATPLSAAEGGIEIHTIHT